MDQSDLFLYQLADSAFPVGGFAYSFGLESALKNGFISDHDSLRSYLITYGEQLLTFDFAFVSEAYHTFSDPFHLTELRLLIAAYESMLLNPSVQKANCILGRNWMKICSQLNPTTALLDIEKKLQEEKLNSEFPIVFGMTLQILNYPIKKALNLFFYMALRDQISAMIRLNITGPSRAHIELKYLMEYFQEKIDNYIPVSYKEAYKTAYLLEIAQLKHELVYSKLFQN